MKKCTPWVKKCRHTFAYNFTIVKYPTKPYMCNYANYRVWCRLNLAEIWQKFTGMVVFIPYIGRHR